MSATPDPGPSADAQPRSVPWVLGWVSFFQDFGSKMLVPIMPLFLTQVLGAPPIAVGLSEGVGEATASLTKSWSGRVADRKSPLPLIRFGYALSTLAKVVIGVVDALTRSPLKRAVVNAAGAHRGTMLGDVQAASGVMALVVGLVVGVAWSVGDAGRGGVVSLAILGAFGVVAALAVGRRNDLLANKQA